MADLFLTGTDITNNPGNAALGYSGTGVEYNANPAIENPFAPVQSTIAQLGQQEENRRLLERQRQIKEQDELGAYLAGGGDSVFNKNGEAGKSSFNILPEDREEVNRAADNLRRKMISNPRTWKFDPTIQRSMEEFEQLKNHAGIRAVHVADKNVKAAATNDMTERQRILQNAEGVRKQGVREFKMPDPYLPSATWNIENMGISKDVLSGKDKDATDDLIVGTETDPNGNEIIVTKPGIRATALDIRSRMVPGSKEYTEAANMVNRFYSDPSFVNAENVLAVNQGIEQYNKDRGLTPNSPNWAPPIGEVLPNGQVKMRPPTPKNVGDIAYSLIAEHAGQLGRNAEVKRTASVLKKEQHDIKMDKTNAARLQSALDLEWAKFNKDKDKLSKDEAKWQHEELEAKTLANTVYGTLANTKPAGTLQDVVKTVPLADQSGLIQTMNDYGVDLNTASVSRLNPADATVRNLAGAQAYDSKGKPIKAVAKPKYAYVVGSTDGSLADAKMVFGVPSFRDKTNPDTGEILMEKDKKTPKREQYMEWKVVSPQEALNTYSQAKNNFNDLSTAVLGRIDRSTEQLNELIGAKPQSKSPTQSIPDQQRADNILSQHKDLDWVKRLYDENPESIQIPGQKGRSTHFMEWTESDGKYYVYPTVQKGSSGKLEYLGKKAFNKAFDENEAIEFDNKEDAKWFAENGYKKGSGVLKSMQGAQQQRVSVPMASIPESDRKIQDGKRMVLYNGEWRHVAGRDADGNLVLE